MEIQTGASRTRCGEKGLLYKVVKGFLKKTERRHAGGVLSKEKNGVGTNQTGGETQ